MARFGGEKSPGGGRILNIFRTLAHHPALLKRWTVFGNHVLFKSTLPARDREILILRIGWLCRAEYEWGQHVVIGKREGLDDEDIEPFGGRTDSDVHADAMISDPTWQALSQRYSTKQMLDLVFTVGQYNLVSMALNTLGVQLDDGIPGFGGDPASEEGS